MKKIFKSIVLFSLVFGLFFGGGLATFADEKTADEKTTDATDTDCTLNNSINNLFNKGLNKAKPSNVISSQNGNKVVEITDPNILKELESSFPDADGKHLIGVTIAYTNTESTYSENDSLVGIQAVGYYLKNIKSGEVCGLNVIRQSTYKGPATATMTIKESISATWSSNTGISASTVSASLGFSVTKSFTVSDSYKVSVPKGKTYTIVARPIYMAYNFDVWYSPLIGKDYKAGTGSALKPIGVCFYHYSS